MMVTHFADIFLWYPLGHGDMETMEGYYELVEDIYSWDEFLERIEEIDHETDGLFEKPTIAHMIVAEHGRNTSSVSKIGELKAGQEATITGKIVDLGSLKTFSSKRGDGKVRNVRIDDGTGSVKIVLWNEETDLVDDMILGQTLRVINGYVQDRGYGMQVSKGKWGEVVLEPKD